LLCGKVLGSVGASTLHNPILEAKLILIMATINSLESFNPPKEVDMLEEEEDITRENELSTPSHYSG